MKKLNRNLLLLSGVAIFLSVVIGFTVQKLLPLLTQQHMYYCQAFAKKFAFKIFTCHLRTTMWIVGGGIALLIFLRVLYVMFRIKKMTQNIVTSPETVEFSKLLSKHNLTDSVIRIHNEKVIAFCFGLLSPKIYVSTAMTTSLTMEELEVVLLHEKHHLENKDSLFILLASFMKVVFPFFPILNDIVWNYKLRCEIKADKAVIRALGDSAPLLSVLKKMLSLPQYPSFAAASLADDTLESRIKVLIEEKKERVRLNIVHIFVSIVSLSFLLFVITTPVKAIEITTPLQGLKNNPIVCLNGSSCTVWCSTSEMSSHVNNKSVPASFESIKK